MLNVANGQVSIKEVVYHFGDLSYNNVEFTVVHSERFGVKGLSFLKNENNPENIVVFHPFSCLTAIVTKTPE